MYGFQPHWLIKILVRFYSIVLFFQIILKDIQIFYLCYRFVKNVKRNLKKVDLFSPGFEPGTLCV